MCDLFKKNIFQSKGILDSDNIIGDITLVVTEEMNQRLLKTCTDEEIKRATFKLGGTKAPGPDGFPDVFYHKCWNVVGPDAILAIKNYMSNGILNPCF